LFKKIFFITITSLFINIILIGFTDRLISRLTNIFDTESTSYTSLDSRFDLTTYAWNYFLKYPITGIGFGSFGINYSGTEDRIEPHNIILEIMSQTGIIGLFLFLLFLFTIFIFIYKKYNRDDNINLILILIIVFLFLQTLISTYLIDSKDLFFWLGVILCYNSINNRYEYKK
jgi:O-antigen ligase